jgi:mannose-6-phosphate isomerase-like protein (cupin superfamily)
MLAIQSYFHPFEGFKPLIIQDDWQVAQLNYAPELAGSAIRQVERHLMTDEVFVLVKGSSVLLVSEFEEPFNWQVAPMVPGITYNIPAGAWHCIAMFPDDLVMIVEKSGTHESDVEYYDLSNGEYAELQRALCVKGGQ